MSVEPVVIESSSCGSEARRKPGPIVLNMPGLGMAWFGGWLFAIGFAHLSFWKGVLALVLWPYYLGVLAR